MRPALPRPLRRFAIVFAALPSCTAYAQQAPAQAQDPIPIEHFVRADSLSELVISPTGKYLAMTVERDDADALVVLRTSDLKTLSANNLAKGDRFVSLHWSGPDRILFSAARSKGRYAERDDLEHWAAINADGSGFKRISIRRGNELGAVATTYKTGYFNLLDAPGGDDGKVLISQYILRSDKWLEEIGEIDTFEGKLRPITRSPRLHCDVAMRLDQPVLAVCPMKEGGRKRRKGATDDGHDDGGEEVYRYIGPHDWRLVKTYTGDAGRVALRGWSDEGRIYALHGDGRSTHAFGTLDPQTGAFTRLFQDPVADPSRFLSANDKRGTVIGVITEAGLPKIDVFDGDHPDAALYASLADLFPRRLVQPQSATRDGRRFLFHVGSDQSPGELYLYDRDASQASLLMRHREWLPAERMAKTRAFTSTTRDGVKVYGYLTVPHGSDGKRLPMIVSVHGGPVGVRDRWMFDNETQLLASRGYAVLRVNFRGSEGYGEAFGDKAYGQWGSGIMHDIIDATQWAIDQGHADRDRICIYGGSFGGYAAMMAPTLAPDLYRCAFGYVGLYDADIQMKKSDTARTEEGRGYLVRALGATAEARAAISPVKRAHLIRIPVYLAAGADDERCPPEHTTAMQKALTAAGNPPEGVIIQKGEGHGFEKPENNLRLYTEMLAFFERHIGDGAARPVR
ncbi:MAG: S9 family peptidase [Lysobacter sp.]|nr:S9 family peptidase [Lysobacter sp.]